MWQNRIVYVRELTHRGKGGLFRDHTGYWVLADFEGPGHVTRVQVTPSDSPLIVTVDGQDFALLESQSDIFFRSCLTIKTECPVKSFEWTARLMPPGCDPQCEHSLPARFELKQTDFVDPCDDASRSEHALVVQNESEIFELEGRMHRSHLNRMSFDISIDPQNTGVLLRRTYDRFHGRQRARVLVDGVAIGYWYAPIEDRKNRWAEDEFFLPMYFTSGKPKVRVEIDPPAGTPLWSVSDYRVFSVKETSTEDPT
jgi:hypothetical protein